MIYINFFQFYGLDNIDRNIDQQMNINTIGHIIQMSGIPTVEVLPSFSRRARIEDFLEANHTSTNYKHNNTHSQNDNIAKNQQEFGHKKRIKP